MAKKPTGRVAAPARSRKSEKRISSAKASGPGGRKSGKSGARAGHAQAQSGKSAADALVGLLASPLVADILAVGAAAALAAIAQQGISRKKGSKRALQAAATAAASAIGERLVDEFHDLVAAGQKKAKRAKG